MKQLLEELSATEPLELSIVMPKRDGKAVEITLAEFLSMSGVVQGVGSDGSINLRPTSGNIVEEDAAQTRSNTSRNWRTNQAGVVQWTAAGDAITSDALPPALIPIIPNAVAADGAGLPAAAELVAGSAGDRIDAFVWMTVDTIFGANQYQFDFRTDPLGAATGPNATNPAWVAVEIPLLAGQTTPGNTWGHRFFTTVDGEGFGIADGANGDWPNNAQVSFYGFYRYI